RAQQTLRGPFPLRLQVVFSPHGDSRTDVLSTRSAMWMFRLLGNSDRAARRTSPPPFTVPPAMVMSEQFSMSTELLPLFARSTELMRAPRELDTQNTPRPPPRERTWSTVTFGPFS